MEVDDRNDEVVQYGGVEVNNNLRAVLSLNPKMIMSVDREEEEDEEELDNIFEGFFIFEGFDCNIPSTKSRGKALTSVKQDQ